MSGGSERVVWRNTGVVLSRDEIEMLIGALDDKYASHPGLHPAEQTRYDELVSRLHDERRRLQR